MTLERIEHKVFASEAPLEEMGQFGSALATTKLNTKDVAEIQALPAYAKGWGSAIISENNYPAMEEMNGVLNVMSYHTGYLYQEGIPVYSASQTYSATSWVKDLAGKDIYKSKKDNNIGNDLNNSEWFERVDFGGNSLKTNQITNCLLEVPQRIKYDLTDGTLTIKAGSVAIFPYGTVEASYKVGEAVGTNGLWKVVDVQYSSNQLFYWCELLQDTVVTVNAGATVQATTITIFPALNNVNFKFLYYTSTSVSSGTEVLESGGVRYLTNTNLIGRYTSKWSTAEGIGLPICLATGAGVADGGFASVDQVFNGFGYIGSTVWVDKGVKGLAPNDRNKDGTLNNIEFTTQKLMTDTLLSVDRTYCLAGNSFFRRVSENVFEQEEMPALPITTGYSLWFNPIENQMYEAGSGATSWTKVNGCVIVGQASLSSFDFKQPFRAVDYNDIKDLGKGMPVGTVFSHTCSASFVPENSLPCNGSEYTQAQFPNLYNDWLVGGKLKTCTYTEYTNMLTTYGQCPMWALDNTNKKFKVPTIMDGAVVQQAMSNTEIGKAYNAGLPNITGSFCLVGTGGTPANLSGAFYQNGTGSHHSDGHSSGSSNPVMTFDASRSSSIYGNSDTVQMNAVALRYFVVVATKAISQSAMDWSNWASSINVKLNADHSNDTKPYITETYVSGTSGYRVWSDGFKQQWGSYNNGSAVRDKYDIKATFLKPFNNANYNMVLTAYKNNNDPKYRSAVGTIYNKTSTSVTMGWFGIDSNQAVQYLDWYACGY